MARDIANLKAAAVGQPVTELCLTALAPATAEFFMRNQYYPSDEAYVYAIAEAMRSEYLAITDAGILLQLDEQHSRQTGKSFRIWTSRVPGMGGAPRRGAEPRAARHSGRPCAACTCAGEASTTRIGLILRSNPSSICC